MRAVESVEEKDEGPVQVQLTALPADSDIRAESPLQTGPVLVVVTDGSPNTDTVMVSDAVLPYASVMVTLYDPGSTVDIAILWVVFVYPDGPDHDHTTAESPVSDNFRVSFPHTLITEGIDATGLLLMTTTVESTDLHPFASVTVTEYVPA